LFADLPFRKKRFIASKCQIVELKKGDVIYNEGDPPDHFYCMVTGRVEIYHPAYGKNHKRTIEYVRKGDYFGSISALTGKPHSVSARAVNDSAVLRVSVEDFKVILHKIPGLGVLLSRSLSRRLGKKPVKEIFESRIIAVYSSGDPADSRVYAVSLAKELKKQSGKKAAIVASGLIKNAGEVSPKLSEYTGENHYVIIDVSPYDKEAGMEIMKQSDAAHMISPSDKRSLRKTAVLAGKLERMFGKYASQNISVILKEDSCYKETSYEDKFAILSRGIYATLSDDSDIYKKTISRIARETAEVRIGLALGSGAAIGLAHIGVLKVLEEEKIPIDIISGSSMGALVAALWASGLSIAEMEKMAYSFKSKLRTLFLIDPALPVRGLVRGRAVRKVLEYYLGDKTFHDIRLPLKIMACDIRTRGEFVIDKGKLVDAVMASTAIPGVFEPVIYGDTQLVDGGIIDPVPVDILSRSGVKKIIAVNVLPSPRDTVGLARKKLNIYNIIVHSFQAAEFTIAVNSCQQADVYLHPVPEAADWYEFYKGKLFIKTGREKAMEKLPEIKKLVSQ